MEKKQQVIEQVKVGILITGNEILYGKTQDTNGFLMSTQLRKKGVFVRQIQVCGDDRSELIQHLTFLSKSCDVILMTGGLGPTSDDLTAEVVADFFQLPLAFNETSWKNCVDVFQKMGRTHIPESNRKQAFLPEGCCLLENKMGTASGFFVRGSVGFKDNQVPKKVTVYCMPGVPFEMEPMFLNQVLPQLTPNKSTSVSKIWQIFSLGESAMQNAIDSAEKDLLREFPMATVSYQAHNCYVTYSVSLPVEAKSYLENIFSSAVKDAFGNFLLYEKDQSINSYVEENLKKQNLSFFIKRGFNLNLMETIKLLSKSKSVGASDIIISYGKNQEGQFGSLGLTIKLDHFPQNLEQLEKRLNGFSWKLHFVDNGFATFLCELKLNPNHADKVKQDRIEFYGLCSLASVLEPVVY